MVLLTIWTLGRPSRTGGGTVSGGEPGTNLYRVIVKFGFMEEPRVIPLLEKIAKEAGIPFPAAEVTYYLGRENFLASAKGHMGAVTESFFSFLQKNSVTADRYFGLPPRQVVELGTQLDL